MSKDRTPNTTAKPGTLTYSVMVDKDHIDAAVGKSRQLSWYVVGFSLIGVALMFFARFDPFNWGTDIPRALGLVGELAYLLLGLGAGLAFGGAYSWRLAHGVILRLSQSAGASLDEMMRAQAALQQQLHGIVAEGHDPHDPHTAVLVTPRLIEIAKNLDVEAMRREIRYADGRTFDTDEAATLAIHVMRANHPAFSADEKKDSQQWLIDHNILPNEINVSPETSGKPN